MKTGIIALLGALVVLSSIGVVVAHGVGENHGQMMSVEHMDSMHEQMTANLDPEVKEQMDQMHENCQGEMMSGHMGGMM